MPSVREGPARIEYAETSHLEQMVWWLSIAVGGVWLVMSLTYPFGWDQGLLAWAGDTILRGGMPYRDAWDLKGPLAHLVYAFAQALFGVHLWSIRIIDVLLLLAAARSVFRAARALTDVATGRWGTVLFVLWYGSHSYWHTAQPDGWAGMLLIIGIEPLLTRGTARVTPASMAMTGACIGAATLLKPLYAAFILMVLAILYLERTGAWRIAMTDGSDEHMPSRRVKRAGFAALGVACLAGWCVPLVATVGWFAMRGALDQLVDVHLRYAALYVTLSSGGRLRGLVDYAIGTRVVSVAIPLIVYGAIMLWRTRRIDAIVLVGWICVVVSGVFVQNRFYAYQWLGLLPAVTLLAVRGFHELRTRMPLLAAVFGGVVLVHCMAPIALEESRFAAWMAGFLNHQAYVDAYGEPGDDMRAVSWLRDHGQPGPIYMFGWNTTVAWLSRRATVSRFGYSLPLLMGDGLPVQSQYRAELLAALRATPPRYVLVGRQAEDILGRSASITDFPALAEIVRSGYHEAAQFGRITIYEMNE